jgi:ParB family transcriptional regulator, chromosome partitioning protein
MAKAGKRPKRKPVARRAPIRGPSLQISKKRAFQQIPLEDLEIHDGQVRTREQERNIDELASSIRQVGVLEPILVFRRSRDGKYQIVAGQRRYLAAQQAGLEEIPAVVMPEKADETLGRILGVTENLMREDLTERDLIDACTLLYKRYGSVQAVADETGIPAYRVAEYVKYERLARPVRELVNDGLDIKVALQAQDIAGRNEDAVKVAKQLEVLSVAQRNYIRRAAEKGENAKKLLTAAAKEDLRLVNMLLSIPGDIHAAFKKFCQDHNKNLNDGASELLASALETRDYL